MDAVLPLAAGPTVSPSAQVERRFYSIVRWFGLIVTSGALLFAIGAGIVAVKKWTSAANENVSTPKTSYEDFQHAVEATRAVAAQPNVDPTLQRKEQEAARAAAEAEFERSLKPHLDAITANLTSYAAKIDAAKPSAPAIGDFVRTNMRSIAGSADWELAWSYVSGMEKATSDLAADGDRLAKFGSDDQRRVRWDGFLQWYTDSYRRAISTEETRIRMERQQAGADKLEAIWVLYGGQKLIPTL